MLVSEPERPLVLVAASIRELPLSGAEGAGNLKGKLCLLVGGGWDSLLLTALCLSLPCVPS